MYAFSITQYKQAVDECMKQEIEQNTTNNVWKHNLQLKITFANTQHVKIKWFIYLRTGREHLHKQQDAPVYCH
jgi:hypothetical protein